MNLRGTKGTGVRWETHIGERFHESLLKSRRHRKTQMGGGGECTWKGPYVHGKDRATVGSARSLKADPIGS